MTASRGYSSSGGSATGAGSGAGGVVSNGALDIYVRDVDGSDLNIGTSSAAPLKTLQAALNLVPLLIRPGHRVIIHVGPHAGTGYAPPSFPPVTLADRIIMIGDGAGGPNNGFTVLLAARTAAAGTSDVVVVDSVGGLGVDAYRGKTIEITSGPSLGDRRTIRNNTATDIVPAGAFSPPGPQGANTFQIVEQAVVINLDTYAETTVPWGFPGAGDTMPAFAGIPVAPRFTTVNIAFTTGANVKVLGLVGDIEFIGVEGRTANVSFGVPTQLALCGIQNGSRTVPIANALFGAPANTSWRAWGLSQDLLTPSGVNVSGAIAGYMVVAGITPSGAEALANLLGGDVCRSATATGPVSCTRGGSFLMNLQNLTPVPRVRRIGGTRPALEVFSRSYAELRAGFLESDAGSAGPLRHGVLAGSGGRVLINSAVTFTTSDAQLAINGGSTCALADLAAFGAAGDHIGRDDGSVIQRSN